MKVKRVPQRTCRGCMSVRGKREMIRVVRLPDGSIEVDLTGKKSGRGAYICPNLGCLEKAIKSKRIEKDLEAAIDDTIYDRLRKEMPSDAGQ